MKEQWRLILALCALILIVVFALQNVTDVQVNFLFFQMQLPMVLVILISVLFGLLLGFLASLSSLMSHRALSKNLQKEREALQADQADLERQQTEREAQYKEVLEDKDQMIASLQAQLEQHHTTHTTASEEATLVEADICDQSQSDQGSSSQG